MKAFPSEGAKTYLTVTVVTSAPSGIVTRGQADSAAYISDVFKSKYSPFS